MSEDMLLFICCQKIYCLFVVKICCCLFVVSRYVVYLLSADMLFFICCQEIPYVVVYLLSADISFIGICIA